MNKDNYVKVMKSLNSPRGMEEHILRVCKDVKQPKKHIVKKTLMSAAALALVLSIIIGVPSLSQNPETGKIEGEINGGLSLQIKAADTGEDTEIYFPSTGTSEPFTNELLLEGNGSTGNDFKVNGQNIESFDLTTEFGELMCEFNSINVGENGEYVWSSHSAWLEGDEFESLVADIENPTRDELIAAAKLTDEQGQLDQLREYLQIGKTDAIDYENIIIVGKLLSKGESSMAAIKFQNANNPPRYSVNGVKEVLDVKTGDFLTWTLPHELSGEIANKRHIDPTYKADLTMYKDTINITVHYKDGTSENLAVDITFPEGSKSTMVLRKG